jgi:hypothetical protein
MPIPDMAAVPRTRMDPPPRSSAADAYDCIMVRSTRSTEYKFVARSPAPMASSPRIVRCQT